jgi:AAA domain
MDVLTADNAALDAKVVQLERKGRFLLFSELETHSNKEWLVHNFLGHAEASAMYGKPGDGKSVLAEDLGLHVAAAWRWHGRPVQHGADLETIRRALCGDGQGRASGLLGVALDAIAVASS